MRTKRLNMIAHEGDNLQDAIDSIYTQLENDVSYHCAELTLEGTFRITEPLRFRSGCTFPITLNGGKTAVIDGGWHVKNFCKTKVNGVDAWCAEIGRELAERLHFDQLFVNGERCNRTVYPENSFLKLTGIIFDGDKRIKVELKEKEKYWCMSNAVFSYQGDLPSFSHTEDISLMINHCWLHERLRIKGIDSEKKEIYTDNASLFAAFPDEKIYLENVFEMLKEPGQWYFNKTECLLYYIPRDGECIDETDIVIPLTDAFVVAEDTANKHINGINFCYCSSACDYRVSLPYRPHWHKIETPRQGECEVPGCIQFIRAKYCSVTNCRMEHVGRYGIEIAQQSAYISICHNQFFDLGTGAVKTYRRDAYAIRVPEDETHHVRITDNVISHYGTLYKAAVGILMTDVHHYTVSHNEISYGEYTAVSCGWVWGYEISENGYNEISYNHIHHIGNNNVCDMGAVYMLGIQPGTVIKNNIIHDVIDREQNGWGIYLDEGSSDMTVENNLVYRVSTETMHIHYGRNNRIVNNIFACGSVALLSNTRHENHMQLVVERNIFYSQNGRILRIKRGDGSIQADKNIYYSETGKIGFCRNNYEKDMNYLPFEEWKQSGNDQFSLHSDPLFVDVKIDNFELQDNSPAFKLGFQKLDLSLVGVRKDETE